MKRNIFIGYNKQFKAQLLAAAIDEVSVKLEKSCQGPIEQASLTSQVVLPFFPDYFWVSPDAIHSWYKTNQFHSKFLDFRRLYKIWSEELDVWPSQVTEEFRGSGLVADPARPRQLWLLEKLIDVSNTLSINYNSELENYFYSLEAEFSTYLTADDIIILAASGRANVHNPSLLHIYQKLLRHDLVLLLKTIFTRINRDLRRLFRSIVHFLFKNMADESDANDFLFNRYLDKNFVNVKFIYNDNKADNRIFRTPPQYKGLYC